MILKDIELENFTNYEKEKCFFSENVNIFIGDNAQGKSNLLDSIYYLANINSSRGNKEKDLIKWGRDSFSISAHFLNRIGFNKVEVNFINKKKEVHINSYKIEKKREYIGYLITVMFSPEDLNIIKGDPSLRRKYLDEELIATDIEYFLSSLKYRKILEQRNKLLKEAYRRKINDHVMEAWEEQLVKYGTIILQKRINMVNKIKTIANKIHYLISDNKDNLNIEYSTKLDLEFLNKNDIDLFKEKYFKKLVESRNKDIERGYTSIGPHRDDLEIEINNISGKKFASQGQQRTVALCLKMAEIEFIKETIGEYPLLLLDDVLSELDKKRKNKLLEAIGENIQTFIPTTDLNDINDDLLKKGRIIIIVEGRII